MSGAIKAYDSRLHKSNQSHSEFNPRIWGSKSRGGTETAVDRTDSQPDGPHSLITEFDIYFHWTLAQVDSAAAVGRQRTRCDRRVKSFRGIGKVEVIGLEKLEQLQCIGQQLVTDRCEHPLGGGDRGLDND